LTPWYNVDSDITDVHGVKIAEHLTYSFSNDYTTLTLTKENGTPAVITRDVS